MSDVSSPTPPPALWGPKNLAAHLQIEVQTVLRWVRKEIIPPPIIKQPRTLLFDPADFTPTALKSWKDSRQAAPAAKKRGRKPRQEEAGPAASATEEGSPLVDYIDQQAKQAAATAATAEEGGGDNG